MIQHGDYALSPLADFKVEARVLSRHDYTFDAGSALAPTDLALGWGRMSDSAVIERLDIAQPARFFTYHWKGRATHSAHRDRALGREHAPDTR